MKKLNKQISQEIRRKRSHSQKQTLNAGSSPRRFPLLLPVLLSFLLLSFTGCTLAKEESPDDFRKDRLYGVYVTQEIQAFEPKPIPEGTTFSSISELQQSLSESGTAILTAVPDEKGDVAFEGMDGWLLAVRLISDAESEIPSIGFYTDPEFTDLQLNTSAGDNRQEISAEGTLHIPAGTGKPYYLYPVWETSDGSVYISSADRTGGFASSYGSSAGGSFTKTIKNETTATDESGTSHTEITSFKVVLQLIDGIQSVTIKEMSQDDTLLRATPLTPEQTSFTLLPDTAYFIAEELEAGSDGLITRSIFTVPENTNSENTNSENPLKSALTHTFHYRIDSQIQTVTVEFLK
ncbi:MAG: hypothetical protein J6B85_09380 [Lachnospiraceae bacterium]|nr:hypothetical protein [Lachnospiraceae bacterium]